LNAITVPQRAVLEGPNTKMVMTVNAQDLVEQRPVQVGDWTGEEWVVTGGLNAGDRVIVDGVVKARPGSPVKVTEPNAEGKSTPAPAEGSSPMAE
jgi:membrane fusion protein (multidrug efflux system)